MCPQKEERLREGARTFSASKGAQTFFLGLQWACRCVEFVTCSGYSYRGGTHVTIMMKIKIWPLHLWISLIFASRPWSYGNEVKYCGRNNIYKFTRYKKTILLSPAKLVTGTRHVGKSFASNTPTQRLQFLTHKYFEKGSVESGFVTALVATDSFTMPYGPSFTHYPGISSLLNEFRDTMPDDLSDVLPPLRDIQRAILLALDHSCLTISL